MEKFCLSLGDKNLSNKLYNSIKGSGAFQRFKKNIYEYGIKKDWFNYRLEAFRQIAIDWCEENDISYVED